MLQRIPVITGTGIISAAGCGIGRVWESIRAGQSGLGPLTLFSSPRYAHHPVGQVREDVDALAGRVRGSRSDKLAWIAAREALAAAGLESGPDALNPERMGVMLGCTVGGMLSTEQVLTCLLRGLKRRFGPLRFHECAGGTDLCARKLGALGPCATVSTACSAGAMAILAAAELIEQGEADLMLAGGTDSLSRLTLNGFGSLLLLDPEGCRPFDARRAGISLGEGAAMLVLEAEESARARGAPVLARLAGWGASCDAFHATAPHPEGRGACAAIQSAFERGSIQPADIDYVSAHGTGTPLNDAAESRAYAAAFAGRKRPVPVSSTKGHFGHCLGAAGALEAAVTAIAIRSGALFPTLRLGNAVPCAEVDWLKGEPRRQPLPVAMSVSAGFGGSNAALVLGAYPA